MQDEFDDKVNTFNLLMLVDGEAIGTARFTSAKDEFEKLPSDKLYDFDSVRKHQKGLIPGCIGMLAVRKSHRSIKVFTDLMTSFFQCVLKTKNDYYIFTLNHECSSLVRRIFGAKKLASEFWSDEVGNFIIPMLLYKQHTISFINYQNNKNSLLLSSAIAT